MTRRDFGMLCIFTTQKTLRENAQPYRFWGLLDSCLAAEEAKRLILLKLYDLMNTELARYLNAEKRTLLAVLENWWDKYAVSSQALEQQREKTLQELNGFLTQLNYLPNGTE